MDCNKDEATRARQIAEKKFSARDIAGAKKFALKAQNLYPGLDGLAQMLATLDVYTSAENKVNGETDWYGILDVNPQADEDTVRKQYRKLALMLHPDKNKSIGAEGAFQLLSEAWSLLSDKAKRIAYDQKRNMKSGPPLASPASTNGFYSFAKTANPNSRGHKGPTRMASSSGSASSQKPKPNTFWTVCHKCKMQYEYLRLYLNHNLLCPNCHEPFFAVETAPPTTGLPKQNSNHSANPNPPNVGFNGSDSSNQPNFQWGPFSKSGSGASNVAQASSMVQQAYQKVKRERQEAQAAMKREEALRRKNNASSNKRKRDDIGNSNYGRDTINQMGSGTEGAGEAKQGNFEAGRINGTNKTNSTKDLSQLTFLKMLMEKAQDEIRKKLKEWNSASVAKVGVSKKANEKEKESEKGKIVNGDSRDQSNTKKTVEAIDVPDPDFHDFDKDRSEKSFGDNQVWAAYDGDDGMPRYYAMIHEVISLKPFKTRISWLNSKTNSELGPLNWVGSGFSKTCGDFRVGRYEVNTSLNSFSHKVRWEKGLRGVIRIYPRKGDVWALYRNWSPDWNELTADEVIHKYDMVEVLEDYNEELGVTVTPLVKVAGFKTIFHQHLDPTKIKRIPREEMFRFSHHVPSYLLTGLEASNAPKGCRELDPAATPLELLQVVAGPSKETSEEEIVKATVDLIDGKVS